MRKVKIFKGIESELNDLEAEINDWASQNGASIVSITGNIAPQTGSGSGGLPMGSFPASDVLVIVLYEGSK
ncbi:MAG: hypothetical protein KDB03_02145 [Planctomycetales bacterium]|nr:hypothetical protein [Planctomycetales bacterium]